MAGRWDLSEEQQVTQAELADSLNEDDLDPDDVDCEIDEHPEGSKRGGHVPVHYDKDARVFYDHVGEEWVPYDH